jgi:hypothetical protein
MAVCDGDAERTKATAARTKATRQSMPQAKRASVQGGQRAALARACSQRVLALEKALCAAQGVEKGRQAPLEGRNGFVHVERLRVHEGQAVERPRLLPLVTPLAQLLHHLHTPVT